MTCYSVAEFNDLLNQIDDLRAERDRLTQTLSDHLESESAETMRADRMKAERDRLAVALREVMDTMNAESAAKFAWRNALRNFRDAKPDGDVYAKAISLAADAVQRARAALSAVKQRKA